MNVAVSLYLNKSNENCTFHNFTRQNVFFLYNLYKKQADILLLSINTSLRIAPLFENISSFFFSLQYNELVDKVTSSETKVSEMETAVEDLQWDIEKLRKREQKLNKHLAEALEQVS